MIRQCDEFLNRPENVDIARRQQEIDHKIENLKKDSENLKIRMAKTEQTAQMLKAGISDIENNLTAMIQQENMLADYFEEEWTLKYIFDDEHHQYLLSHHLLLLVLKLQDYHIFL